MRWAELSLLLLPFALFAAWRFAGADRRWARRAAWSAAAALLLVTAAGLWIGLSRGDPHRQYRPAQWVDGKVIPGE